MSEYIKTSITLRKEDKQFIDSNLLSLSKIIRKTIDAKRNSLSRTKRQTHTKKTSVKRLYNV